MLTQQNPNIFTDAEDAFEKWITSTPRSTPSIRVAFLAGYMMGGYEQHKVVQDVHQDNN